MFESNNMYTVQVIWMLSTHYSHSKKSCGEKHA